MSTESTVYISDKGDDQNDGTEGKPVKSLFRAIKVANRKGAYLMDIRDASLERLGKEAKGMDEKK
jgi:hypothetical protein